MNGGRESRGVCTPFEPSQALTRQEDARKPPRKMSVRIEPRYSVEGTLTLGT